MYLFRFIFIFLPFFLVYGTSVPIKNAGELFGILESKGKAWLEVREDGGFRDRYLAPWIGGSPSSGGGFDNRILEVIEQIPVGNRVHLKWKYDGHLRVSEISLVVPRQSHGVFTGKLIEIGDHWVEFENPEERIPWRFYLRWIGGYPENGGGYDGKSREELVARSDEPLFRFRWSYDVRPRFENLLELENKKEPLFFLSKDLPPATGDAKKEQDPTKKNPFDGIPSNQVNPFDLNNAPKANPFDMAPPAGGNPFDKQTPPKANPFDMAPPAGGNPFDKQTPPKANPFDAAPPAGGNPFDKQSPAQANPFDISSGK